MTPLFCPQCGEQVRRGTPLDAMLEMPTDRKVYMHNDRTALCPTMGICASGVSGLIPSLPTDRRPDPEW